MSTIDWQQWHTAYDDPGSSLSRRLASVQRQISTWLGTRAEPSLRAVSACAGDGRDLLEVLAASGDRQRVRATLLETDDWLAATAEAFACDQGLDVDVRRSDAGSTTSYDGAVPADLVQMCGVFGNITDDDIHATVDLLPALCAPGATVVWTRGVIDGADPTGAIRGWFADAGFEEVAFDAPEDAGYRVGVHRLVGAPRPLGGARTFFRFVR